MLFENHVENENENENENEVGRLVPDLFFFAKALYEVKTSSQPLSFNTFCKPRLRHTIKTSFIPF